jgi:hypothetical protein
MQGLIGTFRVKHYNLRAIRRTYSNGRLAIALLMSNGEPYATLSVNIPDAPEPPEGHFYAKTWSENEHIRVPALESGLFEDSGMRLPIGFVEAEVWKLKN